MNYFDCFAQGPRERCGGYSRRLRRRRLSRPLPRRSEMVDLHRGDQPHRHRRTPGPEPALRGVSGRPIMPPQTMLSPERRTDTCHD